MQQRCQPVAAAKGNIYEAAQYLKSGESVMLIRKCPATIRSGESTYQILVHGQSRSDATWEGWIEFSPVKGGTVLRTEQETSQPNLAAIEYWADGLEAIYFEGALARAQGRLL